MPLYYPIEQLASSERTRFQLDFARAAIRQLPAFDDAVYEATSRGLNILATSEIALKAPRRAIKKMHADVRVAEPKVRRLYGVDTVREPVMRVRASASPEQAERVIHHLVARGAAIDWVDWLHEPVVISAQARLSTLLGYPREFQEACPTGDLRMWLSHYAAVARENEAHHEMSSAGAEMVA